jgi:hypothetical protein
MSDEKTPSYKADSDRTCYKLTKLKEHIKMLKALKHDANLKHINSTFMAGLILTGCKEAENSHANMFNHLKPNQSFPTKHINLLCDPIHFLRHDRNLSLNSRRSSDFNLNKFYSENSASMNQPSLLNTTSI